VNGAWPVMNVFVHADIAVKKMKADYKKNDRKKSGELPVSNAILLHKGSDAFIECFYFIYETQNINQWLL
jgi:hypothetical protein